jgi:hypothetical protein
VVPLASRSSCFEKNAYAEPDTLISVAPSIFRAYYPAFLCLTFHEQGYKEAWSAAQHKNSALVIRWTMPFIGEDAVYNQPLIINAFF